jgi:hypothetical protein
MLDSSEIFSSGLCGEESAPVGAVTADIFVSTANFGFALDASLRPDVSGLNALSRVAAIDEDAVGKDGSAIGLIWRLFWQHSRRYLARMWNLHFAHVLSGVVSAPTAPVCFFTFSTLE